MSTSKHTLEQVINAFAAWRNNKSAGGRIPEELWAQVIDLLGTYKKSHVLQALGISGSQPNKRLLKCKLVEPVVTPQVPDKQPSFIEVPIPSTSAPEHRLEFVRDDGAKVSYLAASHDDVRVMLSWFMEQTSCYN